MKPISPKYKVNMDRPREKLILRGVGNLTNAELVQIMLGSGNRYKNVAQLAIELEEKIFAPQPSLEINELLSVSGVSIAKATKLIAAVEIARRIRMRKERTINAPEKALPFLHPIIKHSKEHLVLLTLNGAKQVINYHPISVGTLDSTLVHPREIFIEAINDHAAGIILAHNHPGQNVQPSPEDCHVTRIVRKAGNILGIELVDHIIVNHNLDFFSFRDAGQL